MAHSIRPFNRFLCVLMIGTFLMSISDMKANAQSTHRIDVFGARALSDAINILERELEYVITYEDPPWEDPSAIFEMFEGGPVVPKGKRLTFLYNSGSPEILIKELLDQYHQQIDTAQYELIVSPEGIYNVVPVKHKNKAREFVGSHLILDTKISLSAQDVSHAYIIEQICQHLSGKLSLGRPFVHISKKMSVSWNSKDARSCINKVFQDINFFRDANDELGKISWSVRRGPNSEFPAFLNVHSIHNISPAASGSGPWHLMIESERPLAKALEYLEETLGCTITYEDTLYISRDDLMMNRSGEPQMPRGGIIDFSYSPDTPTDQVIQGCLDAYNSIWDVSGIFAVEKVNSVFHVFPKELKESKDEQRTLIPYKSILKAPISISERDKTPLDILKTICSKVAEISGKVIDLGEFDQNELSDKPISFSIDNKPTSVVLTEFVKSINKELSWQLFYNPKSKGYTLNIHRISMRL